MRESRNIAALNVSPHIGHLRPVAPSPKSMTALSSRPGFSMSMSPSAPSSAAFRAPGANIIGARLGVPKASSRSPASLSTSLETSARTCAHARRGDYGPCVTATRLGEQHPAVRHRQHSARPEASSGLQRLYPGEATSPEAFGSRLWPSETVSWRCSPPCPPKCLPPA